jgi:hypothetical protein
MTCKFILFTTRCGLTVTVQNELNIETVAGASKNNVCYYATVVLYLTFGRKSENVLGHRLLSIQHLSSAVNFNVGIFSESITATIFQT